MIEHSAVVEVVDQRGKRFVKFAELLEVEIEIFHVRIVIVVSDFDTSDTLFDQTTRHEAVPSKIVSPVALLIAFGFFRDIEKLLFLNELLGLFVRGMISLGVSGAAALRKSKISQIAKPVAVVFRHFAKSFRAIDVLGRLGATENKRGVFRPQKSGVLARSPTTRSNMDISR